ncbi:MAG TPA: O-acetyl-ADP-ribose deacetylase [Phycisphaerae bacterium]|nr:O-acetyl-ADP-ribose deacetylase [Phycisphaerae bacterium]
MNNNPSPNASPWDRIELSEGDITRVPCDAIVNAANSSLLGGGGVDGAIHRAAGPDLVRECAKLGGCPCGEARITKGYRLPAKHVIHTVGPVYRDGKHGEPEKLRSCYESSLTLAVQHRVRTIAFPAISCGVYGYPADAAARIALTTTAEFLAVHPEIERATFVLFGQDMFSRYQAILDDIR